jgi:hypothetical protein
VRRVQRLLRDAHGAGAIGSRGGGRLIADVAEIDGHAETVIVGRRDEREGDIARVERLGQLRHGGLRVARRDDHAIPFARERHDAMTIEEAPRKPARDLEIDPPEQALRRGVRHATGRREGLACHHVVRARAAACRVAACGRDGFEHSRTWVAFQCDLQ